MESANHFVNIKTVFDNEANRSIKQLALIYNKREYLKSILNEVTFKYLSNENIRHNYDPNS